MAATRTVPSPRRVDSSAIPLPLPGLSAIAGPGRSAIGARIAHRGAAGDGAIGRDTTRVDRARRVRWRHDVITASPLDKAGGPPYPDTAVGGDPQPTGRPDERDRPLLHAGDRAGP